MQCWLVVLPICNVVFSLCSTQLIYRLGFHDRITDAFVCLHGLRVTQRIEFKPAVLTYKLLSNQAPHYLGPLVRVADLPGRRALRSPPTPIACWYRRSNCHLSAPELFRSLHLVYGMTCQILLHLLRHYILSGTISKPIFFSDPFRTSL